MRVMIKICYIVFVLSTILDAKSYIEATKVPGNLSNVNTKSKAWLSANYHTIELYPQSTLYFNDKEANEMKQKAKKAKIKVLYNKNHIAYLIEWRDKTRNIQDEKSLNSFADGFAIQIPTTLKEDFSLPYIGMGDDNAEVLIYHAKETNLTTNNQSRAFVSEGFGSMTYINDDIKYMMDISYKNGNYKGVLVRPIKDKYTNISNDVTVSSYAIWDGELKERGGEKLLSSWIVIKLKGDNKKFLSQIDTISKGDVAIGKELVIENCSSCHNYKDTNLAPKYMAPNLSNIGGYSTSEYLLESIINPSAIIVPNRNKNSHESYEWYTIDETGTKSSTMPSFEWLDEKSKRDIVAYLKNLK